MALLHWIVLTAALFIGTFETVKCDINQQQKYQQQQHEPLQQQPLQRPQRPQQQEQGNKEEHVPCVARHFKSTSFVCVCNATYCDSFPPPVAPARGGFLVVTSDMSTSRFSPAMGQFVPLEDEVDDGGSERAWFVLSGGERRQAVLGWGGAITDSAAAVILGLPPALQDKLLESYYSAGGLEYNIHRINIGGCDFSARGYTYVDTPDDVALETFSLQPEDLHYKIPILHRIAAMSDRPMLNIASAWSAPAWMKTNGALKGFGQLLPEMYQPWAEYHVRFLEAYTEQNISFWAITAQNEPLNGFVPGFRFNCMGWTPAQQREWIGHHLGPLMGDRGYEEVKLLIVDDQRINLPFWPKQVLKDPIAAGYVSGIAVHWYMDWYSPEVLTETHNLFPDTFIIATESSEGDKRNEDEVMPGSWERMEAYARDIIEDLEHWVVGWVDWNVALNMEGGPNWCDNYVDSTILVDKEAGEFYKNPMYFAMGHFSKFIRPSAEHLHFMSDDPNGLQTTAFQNLDGTVAIVILNDQADSVDIAVVVPDRGVLKLTAGGRSITSLLYR